MWNTLLITNLLATVFMVGVIWIIQIVHYPLFDRVGESLFADYERDHARLITWVVGPPMLIEMVTALCLPIAGLPNPSFSLPLWIGAALVIVIWGSTWLLQVPCHSTLSQGFSTEVYQQLVHTNWIRTVCWTARGALLTWILYQSLSMRAQ